MTLLLLLALSQSAEARTGFAPWSRYAPIHSWAISRGQKMTPTAEEIASVICDWADVLDQKDGKFALQHPCPNPETCEACMAKAREILRLFDRSAYAGTSR